MSYGVVRTDLMYATDVRSGLVSIKYMGSDGETPTAIENGCVLKVGPLMSKEREIHVGSAVSATDSLKDLVLIDTPEMMYDERKRDLDEFINEAGRPCRGYRFHNGDIFSVTIDALVGASDPAVGDAVVLDDGVKLSVVAANDAAEGGTSSSTVLGSILHIEQVGKYKFYAIIVNEIPAETAEDTEDDDDTTI